MKPDQTYRINGFEQIKSFYSWVFNNVDLRITPQHISLYLFFVNQNNRLNWAEWFKCPMDTSMAGSCIGNKKTYYNCINDLIKWELIEYQKGANEWKSPMFKLVVLNSTPNGDSTVPLSIPQVIPLPTPLPYRVYKLLTDNIKLITDNLDEVLIFLKSRDGSLDFLDQIIETFIQEYGDYKILNRKKEREYAGMILKEYKSNNPDSDEGKTINDLRVIFNGCVNIDDKWKRDNMSLSLIANKYNELKQYFKNGKSRGKQQGASQEGLARLIAKHFDINA